MKLIERIDAARERWNVLEHPFYKRWSCGELTRDELAHYAGEYRHAVVALADTAKKTGHEEHAREEAEHVCAVGRVRRRLRRRDGSQAERRDGRVRRRLDAPGEPARGAGRHVRDRGRAAGGLTGEARRARRALRRRVDEPGAAYFALHSERDHEHAAESRRELELVHDADVDRLVEVAEAALRGNWTLLDGVDARR